MVQYDHSLSPIRQSLSFRRTVYEILLTLRSVEEKVNAVKFEWGDMWSDTCLVKDSEVITLNTAISFLLTGYKDTN